MAISGKDFLELAGKKIGQVYRYGAQVPFNEDDWNGPWDCAEFVSWVVWKLTGKKYGFTGPKGEPWTGAWKSEAEKGVVIEIPVEKAFTIPGAILLRRNFKGGHIAFSDGTGYTLEAMNRHKGVTVGKARARGWTHGILIPDVDYERV